MVRGSAGNLPTSGRGDRHGRQEYQDLPPLGARTLRPEPIPRSQSCPKATWCSSSSTPSPTRFVSLLRPLRSRDPRRAALRSGADGLLVALRLLRRRLLQPQDRPGLRTQPGLPGHRRRRPPGLPHHQRLPQDSPGRLRRLFTAVLRLAATAGLVRLGNLAFDGTKFRAMPRGTRP